jgi:hypothetical protein
MKDETESEDKPEAVPIALDKAALREALAQYQAWNEADFVHRVRTAGTDTLAERWRQYRDLVSFCLKLNPEASPAEQQWTIDEWEAYYASLRRFERERAKREQGSATSAR